MRSNPSVRPLASALAACAVAFTLACARTDSVSPVTIVPAAPNGDLQTRILLVPAVNSSVWMSDALTVGNVAIDGDTLRVTVTYGGGCQRHALQPIAETTWLESYPVQVNARISHNAAGDLCKALITRTLHVDLSPLKDRYRETYQTTSGRIALRLAGATDVPVYAF